MNDLAKEVGLHREYKLMMKIINGVVHSSYGALTQSHRLTGSALIETSWILIFRVLDRIGEYEDVDWQLPPDIHDCIFDYFHPTNAD